MIKEYNGSFADELKLEPFIYLLVIGTTEISKIPGLTIAGATPELTHFTPAADAEFIYYEKCKVINTIPVSPEGLPTPAIISRAVISMLNPLKLVVDAGSSIKPNIPYISLGGEPGGDIRKRSLREEVVKRIIDNGIRLGEELSNLFKLIIIGESIPAGTTTAMAVLEALGYNAIGKVSSASPINPMELKISIVKEALKDLPKDFIGKLSKVSDPVLIAIAAIATGFKGKVLLAGGTQMAAAAAIIRELDSDKIKSVAIGTTRWILEDKSSNILDLVKQVNAKLIVSMINFSNSRFDGLRLYEKGYVKEGVGAGGLASLAFSRGITNS
ncbi:MAG: TIGR00303 family protein, partial [Sulfolobales archaeon]